MEITQAPTSWTAIFREHAREHPLIGTGLAAALLLVLVMLIQSTVQLISGEASLFTRYALLGGAAGFTAQQSVHCRHCC